MMTMATTVVKRVDAAEQLAGWDYQHSVTWMRGKVFQWKNTTVEMLEEFRRAREALSHNGRPRKTDASAPVKTWNDYCEDVGVSRSTVNRWLAAGHDDDGTPRLLCTNCHVSHNAGDHDVDVSAVRISKTPPRKAASTPSKANRGKKRLARRLTARRRKEMLGWIADIFKAMDFTLVTHYDLTTIRERLKLLKAELRQLTPVDGKDDTDDIPDADDVNREAGYEA